jgi:RNA polymerase-associated protein RTF1
VRRHRLEEWLGKPFFAEALSGCMVRVVAGEERTPDGYVALDASGRPQRRYMLARVVGVQEMPPGRHKYLPGTDGWKSPYPFGPDGAKTALWLRIARGGSERPWPMAQVSNSSFTEAEHASWVRASEAANDRAITREEVADAAARLSAAADYVYTAEDVSRLLEEKRAKGQRAQNVALERARLERERDAATEAGDGERATEAEAAIAALEEAAAVAAASRGVVAASMAALNRKNAAKNFQTALKAGGKDAAAGGGDAAAGSTLDPFSRRATRTKNYWNTQRGGEGGNGGVEGDGVVLTEAEKLEAAEAAAAAATKAAQAAAAAAAAAPTLVDLSELDLSLLDLPPRVAPLARKILGAARGRAGAMAAVVPQGAKILSLSEYKRQSGMA